MWAEPENTHHSLCSGPIGPQLRSRDEERRHRRRPRSSRTAGGRRPRHGRGSVRRPPWSFRLGPPGFPRSTCPAAPAAAPPGLPAAAPLFPWDFLSRRCCGRIPAGSEALRTLARSFSQSEESIINQIIHRLQTQGGWRAGGMKAEVPGGDSLTVGTFGSSGSEGLSSGDSDHVSG